MSLNKTTNELQICFKNSCMFNMGLSRVIDNIKKRQSLEGSSAMIFSDSSYFRTASDSISELDQEYAQSIQNFMLSFHDIVQTDKFREVERDHFVDLKTLEALVMTYYRPGTKIDGKQKRIISFRILTLPKSKLFKWYEIDSKRTAYSVKAALRCGMTILANQAANLISYKKKSSFTSVDRLNQELAWVCNALLEAVRQGVFDSKHRNETGRWSEHHPPETRKRGKKDYSKRQTIEGLPDGSMDRLAAAMTFHPVLDLLMCIGLRSVEVHGTTLHAESNGQLVIVAPTGKRRKGEPPNLRKIRPNMVLPAAQRLVPLVGKVDFRAMDMDNFRMKLARTSLKLFGVRVSPKAIRHDLFGLIKELDGPNGVRVSALAGHKATRTSSAYGYVSGRKGGSRRAKPNPIVSVEVAVPAKENRTQKFRDRRTKATKPKPNQNSN